MIAEALVTDDDAWVPAATFTDQDGALLVGMVSFPLASALTADEALKMAQVAERLTAWAAAMKLRALARVEEAMAEELPQRRKTQPSRFSGDESHALAVAEVATACALSEAAAARALHDAVDLTGPQWVVLEALEDSKISPADARVMLDQSRSLPAGQAETFTRAALQRTHTSQGRRRTPSELRSCLSRLRERWHPESLQARVTAARRDRGVWFTPRT